MRNPFAPEPDGGWKATSPVGIVVLIGTVLLVGFSLWFTVWGCPLCSGLP